MDIPASRESRTEYMTAVVTPTERRLIEELARREDRSVSYILRAAILAQISPKVKS